jgi:hypothetical protein
MSQPLRMPEEGGEPVVARVLGRLDVALDTDAVALGLMREPGSARLGRAGGCDRANRVPPDRYAGVPAASARTSSVLSGLRPTSESPLRTSSTTTHVTPRMFSPSIATIVSPPGGRLDRCWQAQIEQLIGAAASLEQLADFDRHHHPGPSPRRGA